MSDLKKEAQDFWPPGVSRPGSSAVAPASNPTVAPKAAPGVMMPPLPSGKVEAPATVPARAPVAKPNVAVINMQRAIQDLSRIIVGAQRDPATKALVSTNKNLNNFIGHHYTKALEEKPAESDPNEPSEPIAPQTPVAVQSIMQHLSGLDNIKVFRPNGIWETKTNNALENIYKFAYSLLQLSGDVGLDDGKIYNSSYLGGFKDKLSGYTFEKNKISLDAEEQEKRATSITKHIHAISRLYSNFKEQISKQPGLRSHIEEKKPFENYTSVGLNLTPVEDQYSRSNATIQTMPYAAPKLPNKRLDYIPIKNLRSKKDYLDWMMNYAGVPTEAEAIGIFNNFIKRQIENK